MGPQARQWAAGTGDPTQVKRFGRRPELQLLVKGVDMANVAGPVVLPPAEPDKDELIDFSRALATSHGLDGFENEEPRDVTPAM